MTPLSRLLSKTFVSSHQIARLAGLGFKRLNITSCTKRSNFVSIFVGRKSSSIVVIVVSNCSGVSIELYGE